MPFTPAHPALVLPFLRINKRYLSATGLLIGSMAPDFEYFFTMKDHGEHGHTMAGLFYFDIPVTFLLALLFHKVIKYNLIRNLPGFFQARFNFLLELDFVGYARKYPMALLLGAAIGACSHLLWDSFTHPGAFFVTHLPFYDSVIPFRGVRYPLYYGLQHISTYAGLLVTGIFIVLMKPDPATDIIKPGFAYWITAILLSGVILFFRFNLDSASLNLGNFVVSSMAAACCSSLVAGLIRFKQANV